MFTLTSPNYCFSAELVFLGHFLLSLIIASSLRGDVLRFLPHFLFRCGSMLLGFAFASIFDSLLTGLRLRLQEFRVVVYWCACSMSEWLFFF